MEVNSRIEFVKRELDNLKEDYNSKFDNIKVDIDKSNSSTNIDKNKKLTLFLKHFREVDQIVEYISPENATNSFETS